MKLFIAYTGGYSHYILCVSFTICWHYIILYYITLYYIIGLKLNISIDIFKLLVLDSYCYVKYEVVYQHIWLDISRYIFTCPLPLVGTILLLSSRDKYYSIIISTYIHIVMDGRYDTFMQMDQNMTSI